MIKVSASLLSCRDNLENTTKEYNDLEIDLIHLDIMDKKFVPFSSFNNNEVDLIVNTTNKPLDVHLMVENPIDYIEYYKKFNPEYITIHYEVLNDLDVIYKIKTLGIKVGISIKPSTNVKEIYELLPLIDLVLIMSVEPGQGGQKFMPIALDKINKLNKKIKKSNLNVLISVDGGINNNSASECIKNGVDILVIGSALSNSTDKIDFLENIKNYKSYD